MKPMPKGDSTRQPHPSNIEAKEFYEFLLSNALGKEFARTARELNEHFQLGNHYGRIFRAWREKAVEEGLLICSSDEGYYIPANREEGLESVCLKQAKAWSSVNSFRAEQKLLDAKFPDDAEQGAGADMSDFDSVLTGVDVPLLPELLPSGQTTYIVAEKGKKR